MCRQPTWLRAQYRCRNTGSDVKWANRHGDCSAVSPGRGSLGMPESVDKPAPVSTASRRPANKAINSGDSARAAATHSRVRIQRRQAGQMLHED